MVPDRLSMCRRDWIAGLLLFFTLVAGPATAREEADSANARVAGRRAHFANEFCGVSAEQIEEYKLKFKATLVDTNDFDASWERGWHNEVSQTIQLRAMRASNPKEYAARVKGDCGRLKWQAKNALRKVK